MTEERKTPTPGAEQIEGRSISAALSQFVSNVDTGAGLMAGGLAVKGLVDGAKAATGLGKSDKEPKE
jgi:hypothetical protein